MVGRRTLRRIRFSLPIEPDGPHARCFRAGHVAARIVADVPGCCRFGPERLQESFKCTRRGFLLADLATNENGSFEGSLLRFSQLKRIPAVAQDCNGDSALAQAVEHPSHAGQRYDKLLYHLDGGAPKPLLVALRRLEASRNNEAPHRVVDRELALALLL